MKGCRARAADRCAFVHSHSKSQVTSFMGFPVVCRRQVIIQTNACLFSIGPLGTNVSENLIKIQNFSFTKMHLKISSAKLGPFCPDGDELMRGPYLNSSALTDVPVILNM